MRLFSENFDFWPITTPTVGSVLEDAVTPHAGASAAVCASGAFNVVEVHPVGVLGRKYFYRIAGRLDKLPSNTTALLRLLVAEVNKLEISVNEAGEVRMWNGAAHPAEVVPKIKAGEWFVIEVMCQVNEAGNGLISWRFNGVEKAAEQAFAVGNAAINKVRFGNPGGVKSETPIHIDDLAVNDATGATDNTWVGIAPDPIPEEFARYIGADMAETNISGPSEPAPFDEARREEFEADAGKPMGIVHMGDPWGEEGGPAWDGYFAGASKRIDDRGAIVMKSLGGNAGVIQRTLAGDYDDSIAVWAEAARDFGRPMFLRLWWEMNGNWFPWAREHATGEEYVAAWRHFHSIVSAIAPNVTFIWCPNAWLSEFPEFEPYEGPEGNYYPGDDYVDWIGVDGYTGQNPHKLLGWRTGKAVFGHSYEQFQARSPDKPIIICEVSCSEYFTKGAEPEPPHKAEWIRSLLGHTIPLEFPAIRAVVWFNWYIEEGGGRMDWPIESSPSATAEFKARIAGPNYVGAPDAGEALLSMAKVPVPGGEQIFRAEPKPTPDPTRLVPKLQVPIRMGLTRLATVEQDSPEDVAASVYALLATERGSRLEDPDYGVEEAGFEVFPPEEAIDEWMVQIERYEPRARVRTVAELQDLLALVSVRVGVQA